MVKSYYFNSDMFRIARSYRGITQLELSEKSNIQQGILSFFEQALRVPDEKQIADIARVLDFPVSFFTQDGTDFPTGIIFHRKRSSLKVKTKLQLEAEVKLRIHCLKLLLTELDITSNVPDFKNDFYSENPRQIAQSLRHYWKVPNGPITNLVKLLEDNGIIVIRFDFGSDLLDGFFVDDNQPCIALNSRTFADRQRFTLAHELGHLLMHSIPADKNEDEANCFASEFLMPKEDIDEYFRRRHIDLCLLAALKPIWHASMGSLLQRARDLKYIAEPQYTRLRIEFSKYGYHRKEPVTIPLEENTLLNEIIETYKVEKRYSDEEMAKAMHLNISDYMRFFSRPNVIHVDFVKSRLV